MTASRSWSPGRSISADVDGVDAGRTPVPHGIGQRLQVHDRAPARLELASGPGQAQRGAGDQADDLAARPAAYLARGPALSPSRQGRPFCLHGAAAPAVAIAPALAIATTLANAIALAAAVINGDAAVLGYPVMNGVETGARRQRWAGALGQGLHDLGTERRAPQRAQPRLLPEDVPGAGHGQDVVFHLLHPVGELGEGAGLRQHDGTDGAGRGGRDDVRDDAFGADQVLQRTDLERALGPASGQHERGGSPEGLLDHPERLVT